MRYPFWSVFAETQDGQLYTRRPLNLGGVKLQAGDRICPATTIDGFNPHRVKGRDLEGFALDGALVLQAVYYLSRGTSRSRWARDVSWRLGRPPR